MSYDVVLDTEAADYLEKEDTSVSERILKSLWKLKEKPTSYGKPLRGVQLWVLRVGDYRVIYNLAIITSASRFSLSATGKTSTASCDLPAGADSF